MKKIIVFIFVGMLFMQGCATTESIKKLEKEGTKQFYTASYEEVWEAALFACKQQGLDVKEADKEKGYISARKPFRKESWGEVVGIWIKEKEANTIEVGVVSRRVGPALLFWDNWERPVLETIENYLKIKSNP